MSAVKKFEKNKKKSRQFTPEMKELLQIPVDEFHPKIINRLLNEDLN